MGYHVECGRISGHGSSVYVEGKKIVETLNKLISLKEACSNINKNCTATCKVQKLIDDLNQKLQEFKC